MSDQQHSVHQSLKTSLSSDGTDMNRREHMDTGLTKYSKVSTVVVSKPPPTWMCNTKT